MAVHSRIEFHMLQRPVAQQARRPNPASKVTSDRDNYFNGYSDLFSTGFVAWSSMDAVRKKQHRTIYHLTSTPAVA
jgi:hypothetical protein